MAPARRRTAPSKPRPRSKPGRTPVWLWLIGGTGIGAVLAVALFFQDVPRGGSHDTKSSDLELSKKAKPTPPIREQDYQLDDLRDLPRDGRKPAAATVAAGSAQATTTQPETKPKTSPAAHQSIAKPKPAAPAKAKLPKPVKPATRADKAHKGPHSWLQAGSFRSEAQADNLKARLILSGLPVRVVRARVKGRIWYRVRIGPYRDNAGLTRAKRKLRQQKIQAVVIRGPG